MGRTVKEGVMVADKGDDDRQVNGARPLEGVIEGRTHGVIGMVVKKGHGGNGWQECGLRRESKPLSERGG